MLTPREYIRSFGRTGPTTRSLPYPDRRLDVPSGATVGVVLLGPGGPETHTDVPAFLYRQYMDPAVTAARFGPWLQHVVSRFAARRHAVDLRREYEAIGGSAPVLRHANDQARMVQRYLDKAHDEKGLRFRVYLSMRYGDPSAQHTIRRLKADGIEHVVLVPLYPQFSDVTTGSSLAYWRAAEQREKAGFTTVATPAYPDDPNFLQAVSERINEALQRFPRSVRCDVRVVFVAHGSAPRGRRERCAPYCCHVHRTVDGVMRLRDFDRPFEVSFQSQPGLPDRLSPKLTDTIARLGEDGVRAVLVVPISFATERVDTAYRLDIAIRREAERCGISHYEMAVPMNCHPLFIRTLADVAAERVAVDGRPILERTVDQHPDTCPRGTWEKSETTPPAFEERCSRCDFADGTAGRAKSGGAAA